MLLLVSVGPVHPRRLGPGAVDAAVVRGRPGANPYPLYAASNLGSFTGLLAYPLVVEPLLRLGHPALGLDRGYGVLILLVAGCGARRARRRGRTGRGRHDVGRSRPRARLTRRTVASWILLSAVPSGLMLSTTTHLSTDIMAMPLLWAIPLGLYLLSFTVAFADRRGAARVITRIAPVAPAAVRRLRADERRLSGYLARPPSPWSTLFAVAVALHSRLYDSRPPARGSPAST